MDVLDAIGDYGRFQVEILAMLSFRSLPLVFTNFLTLLSAENVDHWCQPVDPFSNLTDAEWKDCCVPRTAEGFSHCQRYDVHQDGTISNGSVIQCQNWEYQVAHISIRSEWDLVCDRAWILSALYFTFYAGNIVSYPAVGWLADRFGRRPSILLGLVGLLVANTATFISTTLTSFIILRFISGFAYGYLQIVPITLFAEMVGKKQRGLTAVISGLTWNVSCAVMLFASWIFPKWRTLALLGSFPIVLPLIFLYWWFLPESLRWLVVNKKTDKVKKLLNLVSRKNGLRIWDMDSILIALQEKVRENCKQQVSSGLKGFFANKKLFCLSFVLIFSSFVNFFTIVGVPISFYNLGGSFKVNFAFLTGLCIVASVVNIILLSTLNRRRWMLVCLYGLTALLFLVTTIVEEDMIWLRLTLACFGCMLNEMNLQTLVLLSNELYPTTMRAQGSAMCNMAGRIGGLLGSFVDLMSQKYGTNACYYLFASMAFLVATGFAFFPNMEKNNVPDTVEELKGIMDMKPEHQVENQTEETSYTAQLL